MLESRFAGWNRLIFDCMLPNRVTLLAKRLTTNRAEQISYKSRKTDSMETRKRQSLARDAGEISFSSTLWDTRVNETRTRGFVTQCLKDDGSRGLAINSERPTAYKAARADLS